MGLFSYKLFSYIRCFLSTENFTATFFSFTLQLWGLQACFLPEEKKRKKIILRIFTLLPDASRQGVNKKTCKTDEAVAKAVNISTDISISQRSYTQLSTLKKKLDCE